jgi:hypothetical protein
MKSVRPPIGQEGTTVPELLCSEVKDVGGFVSKKKPLHETGNCM